MTWVATDALYPLLEHMGALQALRYIVETVFVPVGHV